MNRLLSICLLLLTSINLHAQSLTAGLRANASYRLQPADHSGSKLEAMDGDHMNIAPEIFARYTLKKKWAFEASFNGSKYSPPDIAGEVYDKPQPHDTVLERHKAEYFDLTFTALYELTCPYMNKCPVLKRLHSYVGLSVGVMHAKSESDIFTEGDFNPAPPDYVRFHSNENWFWTGITHSLTYDLGKRIKLNSSAYFKVRPTLMLSDYRFNSKYELAAQFGFQLGAAYRIF
jgi:hypothetical protein